MNCLPSENLRLTREAEVLLRYVLGAPPSPELVARYVAGAELDGGLPLPLPPPVRWWPPLMRAFEPVRLGTTRTTAGPISVRLHMATLIADASSWGNRTVYDYQGRGQMRAVAGLSAVAFVEALLLPVRLVLQAWWRT